MSNAKIQMALRHVRLGEELVADQRARVSYWEGRDDAEFLHSARTLLAILESSLEFHRRDLERFQREINSDI